LTLLSSSASIKFKTQRWQLFAVTLQVELELDTCTWI